MGGKFLILRKKKKGAEVWVWFSLKNGSCLKAAYNFKMLEAGIRSSNLVLTEMKTWISWPHMWYWCKSRWEVRKRLLLCRCNILVNYIWGPLQSFVHRLDRLPSPRCGKRLSPGRAVRLEAPVKRKECCFLLHDGHIDMEESLVWTLSRNWNIFFSKTNKQN